MEKKNGKNIEKHIKSSTSNSINYFKGQGKFKQSTEFLRIEKLSIENGSQGAYI